MGTGTNPGGTDPGSGSDPTNPGGGGVGDLKIIRPDGTMFEMATVPGLSYSYASDLGVSFTFTTLLLAGTTGTYCDTIKVTVPGHTISATQTTVTVDGKAVAKGFIQTITGGSIQYWQDPNGKSTPQGDARLDVKYGQWWFAFIFDPGVNTTYHPNTPTPTLHDVPHIGFYVPSIPGTTTNGVFGLSATVGGMLPLVISGKAIVASQFVVTVTA